MPEWAREATSLIATVPGVTPEVVAGYLGRSKETVKWLMQHPLVKQRVHTLQLQIIKNKADLTEKLSGLRERAIDHAIKKLPDASVKEALEVAKFASDYHPDRHFTKLERREEKHTHEHRIGGNLIEDVRNNHLAAVRQRTITVEPISVETITGDASNGENPIGE